MSSELVDSDTRFHEVMRDLKRLLQKAPTEEDAREVTRRIARLSRKYRIRHGVGLPESPVDQAVEVDPGFAQREHLTYLGERMRDAMRAVERGTSVRIAVSIPPRMGKSTLLSRFTPLWILRRHPEWSIMTASYDGALTNEWAKNVRTMIEDNPGLGIALEPDYGAGGRWSTEEGGGLFATSVRGSMTGRGARVMLIDDPIKDFVEAHSKPSRDSLWNWWLSVAFTRLEPPSLVIVIGTRWHEDDLIGRIMSPEHEGNPKSWEYIRIPALADDELDVLGRSMGDPLYPPMSKIQSSERTVNYWNEIKESVGSYTFAAMYQQRPAPAQGAIFDSSWWRYWTRDPGKADEDRGIIYMDPNDLAGARWLDSWDAAFKAKSEDSSWVVGQRWVRKDANRFLIAQKRGRWSFTETIAQMKEWAKQDDFDASPYGRYVHQRLIEEKANGAAIIDTLKDEISGIKPVNPTTSKEARARAITPEVESGNVYLPHPTDPGNEWVTEYLSELRNFPFDAADDQTDATTQALSELRDEGVAHIGSLNSPGRRVARDVVGTAKMSMAHRRFTR